MFRHKLLQSMRRRSSLLCVGLDPYEVPAALVFDFNQAIVEATADLACAYKPNLAIYESMGAEGMVALEKTLSSIPPDIPIIGDGKRGDIANCGVAYADRLLRHFQFDAVTVNPYMGAEALEPFLREADRGIFVLCKTSNPSASEVQELEVVGGDGLRRPLFLEIARLAKRWEQHDNVGLVVGATAPESLAAVRRDHPNTLLLIPGVGAQGGSLQAAVSAAADSSGQGFILSISRAVTFAEASPVNVTPKNIGGYADAARKASLRFRDEINQALELIPIG
jgi:orotidine 5'-phosphate decarboxylase subfamily 2